MSIEQRLRHALDRAAEAEPDELGAYDRFLRRRARHERAVAATTSLVLVVVLALAALVPSAVGDRQRGAAGGGRVVIRPEQGFQLRVPKGWDAEPGSDQGGLRLVLAKAAAHAPGTKDRRASITLAAVLADPRIHPDRPPSTPDEKLLQDLTPPRHARLGASLGYNAPEGPLVPGKRPDGGSYVRTDRQLDPSRWQQSYWIAWPYRCAPGIRCPAAARWRMLRVEASSPPGDRQATETTLRRVVEAVQPVGNATTAGATAERRACQVPDGQSRTSPDLAVDTSMGIDKAEASLVVAFKTISFNPCRLHRQVRLELRQAGPLAPVQGNGSTMRVDGSLPEGQDGFAGLGGWWRWRNWCGSHDLSLHYVGLTGYDVPPSQVPWPPCLDRAKPSTLELVQAGP
jgi:hypothetical protein